MKALIPVLALSIPLSACVQPAARVEALSPMAQRVGALVAEQIRRCYRSPRVPSAGRRITTRLLVRYGPDGALVGLPLLVWQQGITPDSQRYASRMAEASKFAVVRCSPISLPRARTKARARGIEFYLTFSPQRLA